MRFTVVVPGETLWLTDRVAVRVPGALGTNLTDTIQFAPGTTVVPTVQVFTVPENSLPEMVIPLTEKFAAPVLVSVHVWVAAATPTVVEGKVSAAADDVAIAEPAGGAAAPVPDSEIVLVAGLALCEIVTDPLRAPTAVGVKLIVSVQLALGATLSPALQVFAVTAKSLALTAVAASTKPTVPELVSVTNCVDAAKPTVVEAKVSEAADNVAFGVPATTATPVPDSETVLAAGAAL